MKLFFMSEEHFDVDNLPLHQDNFQEHARVLSVNKHRLFHSFSLHKSIH